MNVLDGLSCDYLDCALDLFVASSAVRCTRCAGRRLLTSGILADVVVRDLGCIFFRARTRFSRMLLAGDEVTNETRRAQSQRQQLWFKSEIHEY